MFHILCDRPRTGISAALGDIDVTVGKKYFSLFHIPVIFVRACMKLGVDDGFLRWAARSRNFSPFAFLVEDLEHQRDRLRDIEDALGLPGESGVRALLALRRTARIPSSSLACDAPGEPVAARLSGRS
jgi:hypothetical protein